MRNGSGAGLVVLVATVVITVLVVGIVLLVNRHLMRQRSARFEEVAHAWGWTYTWRAPWLEQRWQGQSFSAMGTRIHHVVSGRFAERDAAVCEFYAYRTRLGVTALATPAAIPPIEMRPAGFVTAAARPFLGAPVTTGIPEIDREWRIWSRDPRLVQAVLTPAMVSLLLGGPRVPLRFVGGDVLTWHEGGIQPAHAHAQLSRLEHAIEAVPDHVWRGYGYDPHAGAGGVPGLKG